jgi:hypothetical protein
MLLDQDSRKKFQQATQSIPVEPSRALWATARVARLGPTVGVPLAAYEVANAQRGEVIPSLLGHTASMAAFPALASTFAAGGATAAAALGLTVPGIGLFAILASLYPDILIGNTINRSIRSLSDESLQVRHLELGGNYRDTASARNARVRALYEMSGATSAARRYLGQEAALMHR